MKEKNKSIILVLGLLFAISSISNYYFSHDQSGNNSSIEIPDETNSGPPKASGSWFLDNITIDPTGATSGSLTWAEAVALPAGWCSGAGTWSDPYVIENVTIDASTSPTGSGIYLNNSENVYFIINNVTVYNAASGGINLENTNNGILINNNCSNNDKGISLYNCVNNTISRNDVLDNVVCGIYLVNCNNNTLLRNTAKYNHKDGIGLIYSNNNTLFGNIARNNEDLGIFLWYCNYTHLSQNLASNNLYFGFWIYNSTKNTLFNNTADYNGYDGIYFLVSENNSIIRNTIQNNKRFGIELDTDSNFNRIFNNTLIYNGVGCIGDFGTGNIHKNNKCINSPRKFDLGFLFLFIIISLFLLVLFLFLRYKKNKKRSLNKNESSERKDIFMKDNADSPHIFQYPLIFLYIVIFSLGAFINILVCYLGKGETWDLYPTAELIWVLIVIFVSLKVKTFKHLVFAVILFLVLDSLIDFIANPQHSSWLPGPPFFVEWEWGIIDTDHPLFIQYLFWTWSVQTPIRGLALAVGVSHVYKNEKIRKLQIPVFLFVSLGLNILVASVFQDILYYFIWYGMWDLNYPFFNWMEPIGTWNLHNILLIRIPIMYSIGIILILIGKKIQSQNMIDRSLLDNIDNYQINRLKKKNLIYLGLLILMITGNLFTGTNDSFFLFRTYDIFYFLIIFSLLIFVMYNLFPKKDIKSRKVGYIIIMGTFIGVVLFLTIGMCVVDNFFPGFMEVIDMIIIELNYWFFILLYFCMVVFFFSQDNFIKGIGLSKKKESADKPFFYTEIQFLIGIIISTIVLLVILPSFFGVMVGVSLILILFSSKSLIQAFNFRIKRKEVKE